MPRLNLYEQQTTAQGPRASGADFGAAPAQALEGAGNELQDIGNRIQERENLSDRQRLREAFEEAAVPMLDDFDKRQTSTVRNPFRNSVRRWNKSVRN